MPVSLHRYSPGWLSLAQLYQGEVRHSLSCVCLASLAVAVLLSDPSTDCVVAQMAFGTFKQQAWLGAEDVPRYVPIVSRAWSPHPNHPFAMGFAGLDFH